MFTVNGLRTLVMVHINICSMDKKLFYHLYMIIWLNHLIIFHRIRGPKSLDACLTITQPQDRSRLEGCDNGIAWQSSIVGLFASCAWIRFQSPGVYTWTWKCRPGSEEIVSRELLEVVVRVTKETEDQKQNRKVQCDFILGWKAIQRMKNKNPRWTTTTLSPKAYEWR